MNARHLSINPAKNPGAALPPARVVAAVYSDTTLAAALALEPAPAAPDWLELRVDAFHAEVGPLQALAAAAPRPMLVTVRHPAEGGASGAPTGTRDRQRLYGDLYPYPCVAAVDIEVRWLRALAPVVHGARGTGRLVVGSFHDFKGVPPLSRLRELAGRAADAGADVFKVAATVERPGQLARLLDLMDWGREQGLFLAVMGMGPLGRISRLALAAAGSVLNYGYLGDNGPQVPGQWPAATLRERISELGMTTESAR